ncbi:MAG: amidohydrolase family protein [Candidatus Actinomarina sp.]
MTIKKFYKSHYIIENKDVIHNNSVLVIDNSHVEKIVRFESLSEVEKKTVIDFGNKIISPGFTNAHSHVALVSVKGLGYASASALYDVMWGVEPSLTGDYVYKLSLLGMMDALKSGTTSINDHYFFADNVAQAASLIGIRGFIGHTIMTEYGPWVGSKQIDFAKNFIDKWDGSERVHPILAPHETSTVDPQTLFELSEYAKEKNLTMHMHLSQTQKEMDYIKNKYNKTPIEHAYDIGILDKNVIAAHCNVVDENDLEILAKTGTFPVFCPTTHGLGGKVLNTNRLNQLSLDWGIGTDCSGGNDDYNMLEEMRASLILHNSRNQNDKITPKDVYEIATSKSLNRITQGKQNGTLENGQNADFIVIDCLNSKMQPLHDVINNIVTCAGSSEVTDVYVNGKEVIKNSNFVNVDEHELIEDAILSINELMSKSGFKEKIENGEFK